MSAPDSSTFADLLKKARQEAGLSQAALARRAGLTGSYISVLESRRRRPPSPRVIRALAKVLGVDDGPLQEAADLERSPPTVRKRLERLKRERGRVHRTRDRLLTTTLFHLASGPRVVDPMSEFMDLPAGQQAVLGRLLGRVRKVRDLGEAESRSADLLEGTSAKDRDALVRVLPRVVKVRAEPRDGDARTPEPVTEEVEATRVPVFLDLGRRKSAEEPMILDARLASPTTFFWRASGDDGHPRIEAGDLLLVDPERAAAEGDLVVFRHEGRDRLGLHQIQPEDEVRIAFPRPEVPPLRIPVARFSLIGVVTLVVRSLA